MQQNRGLSVWQKPKDFFHQILSFLWKGHNKRLWGQTINKTVINQNHTEPNWTKTVIWNWALQCLTGKDKTSPGNLHHRWANIFAQLAGNILRPILLLTIFESKISVSIFQVTNLVGKYFKQLRSYVQPRALARNLG